MRSSLLLPILLVLYCLTLSFDFAGGTTSEHEETSSLTDEERQLLSDCEHPDYRTYIKCLKRHKRHHTLPGNGKLCLEDCIEHNCSSTRCADDCYVKCKRKVRLEESYSRTIETEINNDKNNDRPIVHNVATTVNVNNSLGENVTSLLRELSKNSKIEINNVINNDGNRNPGGSSMPSMFTFSMSMAGYGSWPFIIPQMMPIIPPTSNGSVNCSLCGSLIFKYRCDITCQNEAETKAETKTEAPKSEPPKTDRPLIHSLRCRSPSCVGGH